MKYLITDHKDEKERKEIEDLGLYCYDLRLSDLGDEIATIEKYVVVNRVGSIITDEEIKLGDKFPNNFVDYLEFTSNNTSVDKINELLSNLKTRTLDNNIHVIDLGYRRDEPIAIVEKNTKMGKEYIIAFDYKIKDNQMTWGYGYYYYEDIDKAMSDFKKVLEGGNLSDTFNNKKNEKDETLDINKLKDTVIELIKNNEDYNDYSLEYILLDKEDNSKSIAIASKYDEIIEVNLETFEINTIMDWAYNIDEDVFGELEKNKEIGYMSMEAHYGIWSVIQAWYPEDIENKKGMQKYLKYCKDNQITKEVIEKETGLSELENAMKYYKKDRQKNER